MKRPHVLRRLGVHAQRPVKRAYEQRPAEFKQWLDETYPTVKALVGYALNFNAQFYTFSLSKGGNFEILLGIGKVRLASADLRLPNHSFSRFSRRVFRFRLEIGWDVCSLT